LPVSAVVVLQHSCVYMYTYLPQWYIKLYMCVFRPCVTGQVISDVLKALWLLQLYILTTHWIYVFRMTLTVNFSNSFE
jgi:hypothetical protein